jgi:hypothetical protein
MWKNSKEKWRMMPSALPDLPELIPPNLKQYRCCCLTAWSLNR